ncbi:hypothetical protein ANCDUO_17125 [Ancylostoma duodenale]|uniref:Uncharacterized protein n=1 Tax=Ancylostoma duodenale TaxID=51022 RepID=A0A0C2G6R9_9BILA|nr:hypothetical protein ANCDUO_17125 [Ancylostoma duodenale]
MDLADTRMDGYFETSECFDVSNTEGTLRHLIENITVSIPKTKVNKPCSRKIKFTIPKKFIHNGNPPLNNGSTSVSSISKERSMTKDANANFWRSVVLAAAFLALKRSMSTGRGMRERSPLEAMET